MGGSGSGKTTTLNIFAQRLGIRGGYFEGDVCVNGRALDGGNFGKIGAYVQQDDVLVATMTPLECFTFAVKLRANLSPAKQLDKVDELLYRLGLWNCKDTKIGDAVTKGLSGGERKRCSIGYELITEPQFILLDEPTSGLDSITALKLVKTLKREAERGKTIICTIHSPSAESFLQINRLLLLHEGHEIYYGATDKITEYLAAI